MFEFLIVASLALSCNSSLGFCVQVPAGTKITHIGVTGVSSTEVCVSNEGTTLQFLRLSANSRGWLVEHGPSIRGCFEVPVS
jgi:hypothetical protein